MDNINTLFAKKEYNLVLDLTKDSKDPKELFIRISCFMILGRNDEALDEIEKNQSIIEKEYQLKLMTIHFELLLSKKLFDEAKLALKHYQNLPYVSQETEEFMREMEDRIERESHPNNGKLFDIEEIYDILEKETSNSKISQVLFNLKNYNLNIYIESLKIFMTRSDVNPNFRTYALILLVDEKFDEIVEFRNHNEIIKINPTKIRPPFMSSEFNEVCKNITNYCENNTSLCQIALHLFNCYIIDTYPDEIYNQDLEKFAKAFVFVGKKYLGNSSLEEDEEIAKLGVKIQQVIESTPDIKL